MKLALVVNLGLLVNRKFVNIFDLSFIALGISLILYILLLGLI